jgi:hypothetical protein
MIDYKAILRMDPELLERTYSIRMMINSDREKNPLADFYRSGHFHASSF